MDYVVSLMDVYIYIQYIIHQVFLQNVFKTDHVVE